MKKIIGVALVLVLVATSVFAQVSTGAQFRQRVDIANFSLQNGNATYSFFDQDHKDDTKVAVSASTDNAGVVLEVAVDLDTPSWTINNVKGGWFRIGDVYGWFRVGGFKMTAGKFASRFTNRLVQDRSRALGLSYLFSTYGVKTSVIKVAGTKDGDNMTNDSELATIADYTFDLDVAKLLVQGALFDPAFNNIMRSGFGFEAAFQMDMFTIDLVAKFPEPYHHSFGVYFQMYPVDLLQFAVGATLGIDSTDADVKPFVYGIDGRVRLTPLDALAITVHANFSGGVTSFSLAGINSKKTEYCFGAVANVTYDINDKFAIFGEAGYSDLDVAKTTVTFGGNTTTTVDKNESGAVRAQIGTLIRPVENVKLAASVRADIPTGGGATTTIGIPLVFDISF
ncbi:MAG: hypothetical protein IJR50_07680 [Treponema sp.]|nr:hypothetical protein [Treponema sp.]